MFAIAWHFPNVGILPNGKRHYAARFADAAAVVAYVREHYTRLAGHTRLWRETWYDSTLPHWFLNRTFANTSTLATTTCHRFQDGRFCGVGRRRLLQRNLHTCLALCAGAGPLFPKWSAISARGSISA